MGTLVTILTVGLFLAVAVLLAWGVHAFRPMAAEGRSAPGVNMVREVAWTAAAAVLLAGIFAWIR